MLAVIRPDDWDLPLFLHVLGAMLLVGSLVLVSLSLIGAWRDGSVAMVRLGFRSLLIAALPAWIVMRLAGEWMVSKEGLEDSDLTWLGIGYTTAEPGLLVILIATLLAWLGLRRAQRGTGDPRTLARVASVLVLVMVAAYVVTIWAMTTQPT